MTDFPLINLYAYLTEHMSAGAAVAVYLAALILAVILTVCWIFLPLAVFGIKGRLDQTLKRLEEVRREIVETNRLLLVGNAEPMVVERRDKSEGPQA